MANNQFPEVSVVIPALNEARSIGICIDKAFKALKDLDLAGEVVVADNSSTDGTADIAREHGARVTSVAAPGYGNALIGGLKAATGEYLVIADADDSYNFEEIGPFIDKLKEGHDLVFGNRFKGQIEKGAMPFLHRHVGTPFLTLVARLLFRAPIGDINCGMRAITKDAFRKIALTSAGMELATEMAIKAALLNLKIAEVPCNLYKDRRGRRPHLKRWRDGWRHLRYMLILSLTKTRVYAIAASLLVALIVCFFCVLFGYRLIEAAYKSELVFGAAMLPLEDYFKIFNKTIIIICLASFFGCMLVIHFFVRTKETIRQILNVKPVQFLSFLILALIGSVLLIWSAFYNRYPLVFDDSTGYMTAHIPFIHPIGYSIFIAVTTWFISLWPLIISQAIVTSFLIMRFSYIVLPKTGTTTARAFIILLLVILFTDISKYASWVMPDILTSWLFFGAGIFLLSKSWYDRFFASLAIGAAFFCHGSHVPITFLCAILIFAAAWSQRSRYTNLWLAAKKFVLLVFVLAILLCTLNFGLGGDFNLTYRNQANFVIGKLCSSGILQKTLDTCCPTKNWKLCKYIDRLRDAPAKDQDWYLWGKDSPIHELGGWKHQKDQKEQKDIIFSAFRLYFPEIIRIYISDSLKLLGCIDTRYGLMSCGHKFFILVMENKYPREVKAFLDSRQQRGEYVRVRLLPLSDVIVQSGILALMGMALAALLFRRKFFLVWVLISPAIFIVINAVVCSSLSGVFDRYNTRILWLLPYSLILALFAYVDDIYESFRK